MCEEVWRKENIEQEKKKVMYKEKIIAWRENKKVAHKGGGTCTRREEESEIE